MYYIKNEFNNFLTFCVKMFWCRWDKALFNWSILYLVSIVFVYMGRESNLLFGDHNISSLLITSLVVTLEVTSISFIQKQKINKLKMLHENKNKEFDV